MEAEYLQELLIKEKELRQAEDVKAYESEAVLKEIILKVKERGTWEEVNEWIHALAKRRRQPKQAITGMV